MNDDNTSNVQPDPAEQQLDAILKRVKWIGPGPEPSEDEVLEMANDAVHEFRARRAHDGSH